MEKKKGEKKSELERVSDYMYEIKYWLTTIDKLKIGVSIHKTTSVSLYNCWEWIVYFGEDKTPIYSTDITDMEYCMQKVRDFITRNFKTELD